MAEAAGSCRAVALRGTTPPDDSELLGASHGTHRRTPTRKQESTRNGRAAHLLCVWARGRGAVGGCGYRASTHLALVLATTDSKQVRPPHFEDHHASAARLVREALRKFADDKELVLSFLRMK